MSALADRRRTSPPGICKLGGSAALVTRVSDDNVGRYCLKQLQRYGVATDYVTPIGGEYRNSLAVYESRLVGHQTVIYRNGAADFQMSEDDVDAVSLARFGALITAGTVFAAEPSRSAAFKAFERAKSVGMPIIFDVGLPALFLAEPANRRRSVERGGGAMRHDRRQ